MAAVSRRLARADGVSIVLEYAKQYDTCSEARTAPRVGSTCLTEASACFAYAVRQRGSHCTAYAACRPPLVDDRTQGGALSAIVNNRTCASSVGGTLDMLGPHNCDAHQLSVGMMVTRVVRRALHADDGRDRA